MRWFWRMRRSKEHVIQCNAKIVDLIKYCNLTLSVQSQCHTIISCKLEVSAASGFSSIAHPLHSVESGRNKSARTLATAAIRLFCSHACKTKLWGKGLSKRTCSEAVQPEKAARSTTDYNSFNVCANFYTATSGYVWDGNPWTDTPSSVRKYSDIVGS